MITIVESKEDADKIEQDKSIALEKENTNYNFNLITAKIVIDDGICVFETSLN